MLHLDGHDTKVLKFAEEGKLNIELHNFGTMFEFSEQGDKDAFNLLYRRRAHGTIVMKISED